MKENFNIIYDELIKEGMLDFMKKKSDSNVVPPKNLIIDLDYIVKEFRKELDLYAEFYYKYESNPSPENHNYCISICNDILKLLISKNRSYKTSQFEKSPLSLLKDIGIVNDDINPFYEFLNQLNIPKVLENQSYLPTDNEIKRLYDLFTMVIAQFKLKIFQK